MATCQKLFLLVVWKINKYCRSILTFVMENVFQIFLQFICIQKEAIRKLRFKLSKKSLTTIIAFLGNVVDCDN